MKHRVYVMQSQYLVEIDYERTVGDMSQTITWTWELSIAIYDQEDKYRGKAKDLTYGNELPWITLENSNLTLRDQLIKKCENIMHKHYNF
ncbi:hypothetical protein [Priestia filamentosa]|uniref:hypothetical protein n=1 Tax=Priestia filamentosa TaxID=1402861 RepID=UPI00398265A6